MENRKTIHKKIVAWKRYAQEFLAAGVKDMDLCYL
jgi:hypothetical protein